MASGLSLSSALNTATHLAVSEIFRITGSIISFELQIYFILANKLADINITFNKSLIKDRSEMNSGCLFVQQLQVIPDMTFPATYFE